MGLRSPNSLGETQRERCFAPVFSETMVLLRLSRPIQVKDWRSQCLLSHNVFYILLDSDRRSTSLMLLTLII